MSFGVWSLWCKGYEARSRNVKPNIYPFEGDCDPPVLYQFGIRASGSNLFNIFFFIFTSTILGQQ